MSDPSEILIRSNQSFLKGYFCCNPSFSISQPVKEPFKLAAGLFVIPIMMAYSGLINTEGNAFGFVIGVLQTLAIIVAMAMAVEGYLLRALSQVERIVCGLSLPLLLFNPAGFGLLGLLMVVAVIILQWHRWAAFPTEEI